MTKEEKALHDAIFTAAEADAENALQVITSHFVSLTLELIRRPGMDPEEEDVTIEGGRRKIIICKEYGNG